MRVVVLPLLVLVAVLVGCAGMPVSSSLPQTEEGRAALFADRVATDENGALCAASLQMFFEDPAHAPHAEAHREMLMGSYDEPWRPSPKAR